jgi:pyrroline-5-carboxylate reductase
MGTILLQAFLQKGLVSRESVIATVQHEERAKAIAKQMGITVGVDNRAAVSGASTVLVCVKPQTMSQLLDEISPALKADALVISIVASAPVKFIQQRLGNNKAVLRAMPNTPASVGAAMTAIATGSHAGPAHLELAKQMFESIGRVAVVDEKHMDAVTALSASGPAFVFVIDGRSGSQGWAPTRTCYSAGRSDSLWLRPAGASDWPSSCPTQRRGDHTGWMHHRWNHGA